MAFLRKNALIGHWSISLQSVKITSSWMIAVERRSVQKLYSFAITLLQIFDLFFTGSQVATVFVMSHTVFIEDILFIRNYVATLRLRDTEIN